MKAEWRHSTELLEDVKNLTYRLEESYRKMKKKV